MAKYIGLLFVTTINLFIVNYTLANDQHWQTDKKILNIQVGGLDYDEQDEFMLGRSFFTIPWVEAPSATTARDGVGPLFNANTCTSCHRGNGVGEAYNTSDNNSPYNNTLSRALVTKLSRKSGKTVPFYGNQLAVNGTVDVAFEGIPVRSYKPITVTYPDKEVVTLKKPIYAVTHLNYGPLPDDVIIVQRRAPALVGLGLLGKVSDETILEKADLDDKDGDGISGKPNWVIDANGNKQLGRYTTKAAVATVRQQVADAAVNDMGLTNPVFPHENCTPEQTACLKAPKGRPDFTGNTLDLTEQRLDAITYFVKHTRIPKIVHNKEGERGKELFASMGCTNCHRPEMKTRNGATINPYSDFLLHDMGEGLADGRTEFDATGNEFKTAPLWGLSTYRHTLKSGKPHYLHDARAETIEEAILWHDGEAKQAKNNFMHLPKKDRQAIFTFLNQL